MSRIYVQWLISHGSIFGHVTERKHQHRIKPVILNRRKKSCESIIIIIGKLGYGKTFKLIRSTIHLCYKMYDRWEGRNEIAQGQGNVRGSGLRPSNPLSTDPLQNLIVTVSYWKAAKYCHWRWMPDLRPSSLEAVSYPPGYLGWWIIKFEYGQFVEFYWVRVCNLAADPQTHMKIAHNNNTDLLRHEYVVLGMWKKPMSHVEALAKNKGYLDRFWL